MLLSRRMMVLVMGKGSKRRPQVISNNEYDKAWEQIFGEKRPKARKKTPPHASTQLHKDKTKIIPRKTKHK
tara:strand:- start:173 stop:385 length:213 start_codon:yes stop_codon:yes gene_type:complete